MRKNVFGRRLKRDRNERKALFKSLMSSLVLNERIKTTEQKAKAIKGEIEKLVTKVKKDQKMAVRYLPSYLSSEAIKKMILEIAPRFSTRLGGYTRIIKLGERFADNARMVIMEWVEGEVTNVKPATTETQNKNETLKESKFSASENFSDSVVARETSGKNAGTKRKTATRGMQKRTKRAQRGNKTE